MRAAAENKALHQASGKQRVTKKMLAVDLYERGMHVIAIAKLLRTGPSYIANALVERGFIPGYVDLYTSSGVQNECAAKFKELGGLRFRDLEAAKQTVERLEVLSCGFRKANDRGGLHHCQVLALIGKNRAEGIGKLAESRVFADWLAGQLREPTPAEITKPPLPAPLEK